VSDKPDDPMEGADRGDAVPDMSAEDLDALLAQVDSLTSELEEQLGGEAVAAGEGGPAGSHEALDELAEQVETQVRQIHSAVDAGVAEAHAALGGTSQPAASPDAPEGGPAAHATALGDTSAAGEPEAVVTEDDHLVAEEEIASALDGQHDDRVSQGPADDDAARDERLPPRWAGIGGLYGERAIAGLAWLLEQADRPFMAWPRERKALIGYVALATLAMAVVTWVTAAIIN
jgi:hypothetical protein